MNTSACRVTCVHDDSVTGIICHPVTDSLVFTSSVDRLVRQWDLRTGKCEKQWKGHQDAVLAITLTE